MRSDAGTLIDKELNEFEINNIYYDFSKDFGSRYRFK